MDKLLNNAINGDELSISRILTKIEYMTDEGLKYLDILTENSGKAYTIGITGIPGAGKSTLISTLIEEYTKSGHRVGVIMIDPSSPISMGSFMGNRIRMQDKTNLNNVFIRSIASRGHLGGFSSEAIMLIEAMDGLGFDPIIVETVGAGQTDTEVVSSVHSVIVVNVPGTGDEIQALKAGIMEIGDIYIVNKADLPDAEVLYDAIKFAIDNGEWNGWKPPVIKVSALKKQGIKELLQYLNSHKEYLYKTGKFEEIVKKRRKEMIELILRRKVNDVISRTINSNKELLEKERSIQEVINTLYSKIKENL
ncbi:methylmalonyl Co-A mutase-associated GTPase MeaB [Acidianus sulfidivorans JP7]|uniref:Methylmalonyl Co-A mutase-associated GTPase MeaB n=1 Tax=Acidianus sulfidivorans JP7 TaxID=619593 RepID=A0A2U9ILZ1_9CREN|nr:methylmalonyl Co-A mutase-associated GTPase MeaB [Acidianus sulfidivorans]AWR97031.1 methylmalonyl Co-A mutase-associated GTPase MeaB [Acidianus sulfidivorans JP7]